MSPRKLIGRSIAMEELRQQLRDVAASELTVLLLGETGTGKGVAAELLHAWGPRREQAFVPVNCGALHENLIDSELFGHEQGAFTGAVRERKGKFQGADGGTLFLDEIGDLALASQARLLRVLQERCIERVGGTRAIPVDVRVVAATHQDLERGVGDGTFRENLFYRLSVFPIRVPSLRDRREDIPELARHFLARHFLDQAAVGRGSGSAPIQSRTGTGSDGRMPQVTDEAMARLLAYEWPGNVRQLEHVLQRAAVLARGAPIGPEHLDGVPAPRAIGNTAIPAPGAPTILPLAEYERRYLVRVLEHTNGVIHGQRGAALLLGMKPTTLRSRLERLGIDRKGRALHG